MIPADSTGQVLKGISTRMSTDLILAILSRWIHVGTAIVLLGGTVCLRCVVHPIIAAQHPETAELIRGRWKKFVHGGILLLMLSGFFNYIRAMGIHKGDSLYHALVGTKILLAFGVFFIASALVGRSAGTQRFRDAAGLWMTVVIVLSFVIAGISGVVKVRGVPEKVSASETQSTASGV